MDVKLIFVSAALLWRLGCAAFTEFRFKALQGCKENFAFFPSQSVTVTTRSKLECGEFCSRHPECLGFNFCTTSSATSSSACQLVSQWSQNSCGLLSPAPGCFYRQMDFPCVHGSVDKTSETCICSVGAYGQACDNVFVDCYEGMARGLYNDHRASLIQPNGTREAFTTNCNFAYGLTTLSVRDPSCSSTDALKTGTWQTLQQHSKSGGCIFIGLDNIYRLLNQGVSYRMSAYVVYDTWDNARKVYYSPVTMNNSTGRYTLTLGPVSTESPLGDGFPGSQVWKFCSPDHDCSGCAAGAGHAGWFDDSGVGCKEAKGLGHPLQWPVNGTLQNVIYITIEIERL